MKTLNIWVAQFQSKTIKILSEKPEFQMEKCHFHVTHFYIAWKFPFKLNNKKPVSILKRNIRKTVSKFISWKSMRATKKKTPDHCQQHIELKIETYSNEMAGWGLQKCPSTVVLSLISLFGVYFILTLFQRFEIRLWYRILTWIARSFAGSRFRLLAAGTVHVSSKITFCNCNRHCNIPKWKIYL